MCDDVFVVDWFVGEGWFVVGVDVWLVDDEIVVCECVVVFGFVVLV